MSIQKNFPLVAPDNTLARAGRILASAGPSSLLDSTYQPTYVGGVIPKNAKGYPISMSDLDHLPVVLGWPGQFLFTAFDPALDTALAMPPRPMTGPVAGSSTFQSGEYVCYDNPVYFGKTGTIIAAPKAIVSGFGDQATRYNGSFPQAYNVATASSANAAIAAGFGASLLTIPGGNSAAPPSTGIGNSFPILQPFPISGFTPISLTDASHNHYYDFTIDPTCFIGGQILSMSWHGAVPPYTFFYGGTSGDPPQFPTGATTYENPDGFGESYYTAIFTASLASQIAQVNAAIPSLRSFRHIFVIDNGQTYVPDNATGDPSTVSLQFLNWNGIISLLTQPWMQVVVADFSNPSMPATVISAAASAFFV